jgi:hypothetical protein
MHIRKASLSLASLLMVSTWLMAPISALGCIGGIPFRHAIAETRGGILEGRIISAVDTIGRGIEVELGDARPISGQPDLVSQASLTAGAICEQSIDAGETVWLLYEVGDLEIPPTLTIAYVVDGPDAVSHDDRRWALGVLPDTSTESSSPPRGAGGPWLLVALWLALVTLIWRFPIRGRTSLK